LAERYSPSRRRIVTSSIAIPTIRAAEFGAFTDGSGDTVLAFI
jgi:hypothetical protein